MSKQFDVIVLGAGPGGYVAAIRCAQLGLKTACIDEWVGQDGKASPGGTCLNVGCIPSKAMIESSELYEKAQHEMADHGVQVGSVKLDLKTMLKRKDQVVKDLTSGVAALFMANKITFLHGRGKLLENKQVEVTSKGKDECETIQGKHIIIATGSTPSEFPLAPYDHKVICDSTDALDFDKVPKKLGIIGAGVIALELGSVWRRLGSDVTLLKSRPGLLPTADQQVAKEALKQFEQQGLKFVMGAKISKVTVKANKAEVTYSDDKGEQTLKFDKLILAVGRTPCSEAVIESSVKISDRGFIEVDEFCRTNLDGIYAIGDVVRGPMLAHKASEEGIVVAELIADETALPIDLDAVPSVIYTDPEIAWVGKNEQELAELGIAFKVGQFPFNANGRARALGNTKGFVKILADEKTDRILGVHLIGPQASEMISEAKIAMEFKASSEDLALSMFAHPTLSEALHEAALSVDGRAIHAVQAKKKR